MREPPTDLTDDEVLSAVQSAWDPEISGVEHLAVGFGAHHWRADVGTSPRRFITYDRLGRRHTLESLEQAYEGAMALAAAGLEFVVAPVHTRQGATLLPLGAGVLSCTSWLDGEAVGGGAITEASTATANLTDLARLHSTRPPPGLRRWAPIVGSDFAEDMADRLAHPWNTGPYGEPARLAASRSLHAVQEWTTRYLICAEQATTRSWVATHGETHTANQMHTVDEIRFVDWESLLLAPRERDLTSLIQAGYGEQAGADPVMVELFDLEWRLSEIDEYTQWFSRMHHGTRDDAVAFDGLLEELDRDSWWPRR